ncbi:Protein NRT1/ PTR FAMILY 2.8 [Linum perenne]
MNLCVLAFLFGALGLLSIGADRIRPCKIAFDADQFDTSPPKGLSQLECFFNCWQKCWLRHWSFLPSSDLDLDLGIMELSPTISIPRFSKALDSSVLGKFRQRKLEILEKFHRGFEC